MRTRCWTGVAAAFREGWRLHLWTCRQVWILDRQGRHSKLTSLQGLRRYKRKRFSMASACPQIRCYLNFGNDTVCHGSGNWCLRNGSGAKKFPWSTKKSSTRYEEQHSLHSRSGQDAPDSSLSLRYFCSAFLASSWSLRIGRHPRSRRMIWLAAQTAAAPRLALSPVTNMYPRYP